MKDSAIFSTKDLNSNFYTEIYNSPLGNLCIAATDKGLRFIKLVFDIIPDNKPNNYTQSTSKQLTEYFNRERKEFDIELDWGGYTEFTIRVWQNLLKIPFGETTSYLKLSKIVGDAKAIRAVGTANGRNPIPIIVPCHRVIGSDGNLTGFALGLDFKRALLTLENPEKFGIRQISLSL